MSVFKPSILTLALLSAGVGSFSAYAVEETKKEKEAAAKEVEVIEVRGVRSSIIKALDTKRNADVVGDFIGSGDLGVLPDASIADALGRVSGVTTVRESGQSSQLNIRGMNGDFIQTTLNGREQASTSGRTESSRWMAFDQYPAELITEAAVFKSPKASHIEGGVAATVELKTANPLQAEKDNNFTASYRASFNDAAKDVGADENGHKISFSYQGKFLDETLGLGLGYSRLDQPNNFEGARAGADGQIGYQKDDVNGDGTEETRVRALQYQAGAGTDIRNGYLATLVYQPHDNFKAQLDYFKSEYESEDLRHGVTIGGLGSDTDLFSITDPNIVNGSLIGATIGLTNPNTRNDSSPWFETRSEDQSIQADSDAIGLNIDWQITDNANLKVDIAHSEGKTTRKDRLASLHAYEFGSATGLNENGQSVTGETWQELSGQIMQYMSNGDGTPTLGLNTDLTDTNLMRLSRYEEYPHEYLDDIDSLKVDFKYSLDSGFISSIETGIRYSKRTFDSNRGTFLYGSRDGQFNTVNAQGNWESWCADNLSSSPTLACEPQSVAGFSSIGSVNGAPDHLVVDLNGLADSIFGAGNYQGKQVFSRDWTFIESGKLEEKVFAYYLMANIETEVQGLALTGNFGVRVVKSDVKASGIQNVGTGLGVEMTDDVGVTSTNYDHIKYGPKDTDVLPSLNLNLEMTDQDMLRFAAAKVMGRPPAGQLKGGAGSWVSGVDGDEYNVWSKGSPFIKPFMANQFDLSYEHYFEDNGAVTVALFWKDIDTLVEDAAYGPDDEWVGIEIPEGFVKGDYYTKQNSDKGGYIRGLELALTQTFEQLPGVFSGLGLTASYSYTESEAEISGGNLFGEKMDLPGLSKNVWSTTIFWDIDNFSTHINVRYRDDFVINMAIPGSNTPIKSKEYTTVDMQASYDFENGVTAVLQGNNLTDEANVANYGVDSLLGEYKSFGRQYYLGINYKF
ncbi:TonB-dependent receptor [Pseudoalteromonas denitrificans]|nr:TonB-dependent receptor [Pseudoalteromonas denitrificans]